MFCKTRSAHLSCVDRLASVGQWTCRFMFQFICLDCPFAIFPPILYLSIHLYPPATYLVAVLSITRHSSPYLCFWMFDIFTFQHTRLILCAESAPKCAWKNEDKQCLLKCQTSFLSSNDSGKQHVVKFQARNSNFG